MNPERWRQIRTVFDNVRMVAPDQWSSFLDSACQGDPNLRAEVESLLSAEDAAAGFLQSQTEHSPSNNGATHPVVDPWIGKQIGPYKILERIGSGGVGVVYRAVDTRLGVRPFSNSTRSPTDCATVAYLRDQGSHTRTAHAKNSE